MATNEEILTPKALILPVVTPAITWTNATKGTLVISGAKLYFHSGTAWELVTSTAT